MPVFVRFAVCCAVLTASASAPAAEIDFNRDVRPILSDKCFHCHGPDAHTREADLRFDLQENVFAERDGHFIIKPGEPQKSALVSRINSESEYEVMPPPEAKKPLTKQEIEILTEWIKQGAEWSAHWAYVLPQEVNIPDASPTTDVTGAAVRPRNAIDNLLLHRLQSEGIPPSPEAAPVTLLRRVCFDLTGLPPTSAQAEAFLKDPTDAAFERLVDELLASEHFGERMAIYWLDLVRYADTVGYHGDQVQNISPYRDWVIDAFNANMPFDRFTIEQLAGDLLPDPTTKQLIATGYNRLLQTTHEGGLQPAEYRAIYQADRVRNVSAVWMGATVGCAQCHDHKFDPYTAKDFYALSAFFADVDDEQHFKSGTNSNPTRRLPEIDVPTAAQSKAIADVQRQISEIVLQSKDETLAETQKKSLAERKKRLEAQLKSLQSRVRRTMVTQALSTPRTVRVLPRGNWLDNSGPVVEPAIPEFLGQLTPEDGGRADRLDLAEWLVDADDGSGLLTSRVMVNRFWALLFGDGLSTSLDDFGGQGQPPVHPELLDWLSRRFVDSGWDIKETLKEIVLSRAYRQSSMARGDLEEVDPNNRLFARQTAFRLPAEMVRDNALAISGLLVRDVGGPSVKPYQPVGYYRHLNFPTRKYQQDHGDAQWRRGVYVHWQRQYLHPMLKAFDAPTREECTAERPRSNTPLAALVLLNDPTFVEAAKAFAKRTLEQETDSERQRLAWAFEIATTRPPTPEEVNVLTEFLVDSREDFKGRPADAKALLEVGQVELPEGTDAVEMAAWTSVCRAILNLAEVTVRN